MLFKSNDDLCYQDNEVEEVLSEEFILEQKEDFEEKFWKIEHFIKKQKGKNYG